MNIIILLLLAALLVISFQVYSIKLEERKREATRLISSINGYCANNNLKINAKLAKGGMIDLYEPHTLNRFTPKESISYINKKKEELE